MALLASSHTLSRYTSEFILFISITRKIHNCDHMCFKKGNEKKPGAGPEIHRTFACIIDNRSSRVWISWAGGGVFILSWKKGWKECMGQFKETDWDNMRWRLWQQWAGSLLPSEADEPFGNNSPLHSYPQMGSTVFSCYVPGYMALPHEKDYT